MHVQHAAHALVRRRVQQRVDLRHVEHVRVALDVRDALEQAVEVADLQEEAAQLADRVGAQGLALRAGLRADQGAQPVDRLATVLGDVLDGGHGADRARAGLLSNQETAASMRFSSGNVLCGVLH